MPKPVRKKTRKRGMLNSVLAKQEVEKPKPIPKYEAWCNVKPLLCSAFPNLKRGIGLTFSVEFIHRGNKKRMVDCEYETISVNTSSYGSPQYVENIEKERASITQKIVADIDKVVEELGEHRHRLLADLAESQDIPF